MVVMPLRAPASSRPELLGDVALAVVVFAASVALMAASGSDLQDGGRSVTTLGVLLAALASLPLIARRRSPLGVFVLTAAASVALRVVAEPAGPPVGPTVALYFVAAAGQVRAGTALAVAAVLLAAHAIAMGVAEDAFPGTAIAFGVLVWGSAWLAGERARLRTQQLQQLQERARRAEREAQRERRLAAAEERTRIARDLHDSAGHAINVILVHAGLGRLRATQDGGARDTFQTIEDVARQTVAEIDQLVAALREDASEPDVEPPPGLAALDTLLQRHRAAGLDVTSTIHGDRRSLPPSVDRGAYRILQEALTNTARHGNGSAEVEIAFGRSALEITVANPVRTNGTARESRGGHGLIGMRERAVLLGGSLDTSAHDGHFRLHARLPYASGRA